MGSQTFGRYTLEHLLAVGGMGEVFVALDHGASGAGVDYLKPCVVKRILPHLATDPQWVDMFTREASLAAQLSHSNIVQVHDHGLIDGHYFMAMEYVQGRDLKSFLDVHRQAGTLVPVPQVLFVAAAVARALDYAHRMKGRDDRPLGLVHRDVSPQNVLLSQEGDVKLADFGVVKTTVAGPLAGADDTGTLVGKVAYLSPEQARGEPVDHRSDVFSLGVVLAETLLGRHPFQRPGESTYALLDRLKRGAWEDPDLSRPDVPEDLAQVVRRCLAPRPEERFPAAADLLEALETVMAQHAPRSTAAALARYISASCPAPSVPAVVARATRTNLSAPPSASPAKGSTREASKPVGSPSETVPPAPAVSGRPTRLDRTRPSPPEAPAPDPVPGPVPGPLPGPADDPSDDDDILLPPPRPAGRWAWVALAGVAAAGLAYLALAPGAPPSPATDLPPPAIPAGPPPSLRPAQDARPPTRVPPPRTPVQGPVQALPPRPQPAPGPAPAPPPEPVPSPAPEPTPGPPPDPGPPAKLVDPPPSPGLPPGPGLRLNATRKVTVVVDGDERLESIQGATDLPMGSREVVLSFGGVSRLTVRVADAGDGGRVLQVESAQPALVLVDGKPRGGTPQSVRGGPKGVALSVSGPGWAVSLGVR